MWWGKWPTVARNYCDTTIQSVITNVGSGKVSSTGSKVGQQKLTVIEIIWGVEDYIQMILKIKVIHLVSWAIYGSFGDETWWQECLKIL